MTVTIYDVAREASVSMATVSRVVNHNPNVKLQTRRKVYEAIERLVYRPTAVFAAIDEMAIGVIHCIQDAGLHVPRDFSIISVDNIRMAYHGTSTIDNGGSTDV